MVNEALELTEKVKEEEEEEETRMMGKTEAERHSVQL